MLKILYHGSEKIIERPKFGVGNPHNDYGLAFYCTEVLELAKEWACPSQKGGFANIYTIDISKLSILNLSTENYNILNWISLLIKNRIFTINNEIANEGKEYLLQNFLPDISDFDIIIGYRADDSYFSFARAFLNNAISIKRLASAMKLGNLGEQIVIKSKKAFENLKFENHELVDGELYYEKRKKRDSKAKETYLREMKYNKINSEDIFLIDIIREQVKQDDKRLR